MIKPFLILIITVATVSCSSKTKKADTNPSEIFVLQNAVPHKGAVLAGDFPDPSVIKVKDRYWATATTSAWAPAFSLMTSTDLANWKVVGSVFTTQPDWADGNFWAPELSQVGSTFYVYYAAKGKVHGRMCVAVATSSKVEGPYQDHGPLICQKVGSIDAFAVTDENRNRFLFWKEDGNSQKLPTPIWVQPLSKDGLKLIGKPIEAIRNDAPWENHLVEGPNVFRRGDYWYMFYAADSCCTKTCDYKVGVARSKNLAGPWEKNPNNPIISGNDAWKCPGHGTVVTDEKGNQVFMYHAYNAKDSVYVGRQAMADVIEWQSNNWPVINAGEGPSDHTEGLLGKQLKNEEHVFIDEFDSKLSPGWQWPHTDQPKYSIKDGKLLLSGAGDADDPMKAIIAHPTTTGDYVAKTKIDAGKLKSGTFAGLAALGDMNNAIGASVAGGNVYLWTKAAGRKTDLTSVSLPKSDSVYLRLVTHDGFRFHFEFSTDDKTWTALTNEQSGEAFPPWDLGIRVGLTAGGPTGSQAIFDSFSMFPLKEVRSEDSQ